MTNGPLKGKPYPENNARRQNRSDAALRRSDGRTAFETIIILVFVGLLLIIAINKFMQNVIVARESLLQSELVNIRMSIKLYEVINGKYPESLKELAEKKYIQPYSDETVIKGKYLTPNSVNEEGQPLDPFGNQYYYNKKTGEIKTLTKGYEGW